MLLVRNILHVSFVCFEVSHVEGEFFKVVSEPFRHSITRVVWNVFAFYWFCLPGVADFCSGFGSWLFSVSCFIFFGFLGECSNGIFSFKT